MRSEVVKDIADYMTLPYTIILRKDDDGEVVARIAELPGCLAHGPNEIEAIQQLKEMQRLWLEDCIEAGHIVPEPEVDEPLPSGKWVQRVPRSLHQKLVRMAKQDEVSLNQLVTSMLSGAISARSWEKELERQIAQVLPAVHYWDTSVLDSIFLIKGNRDRERLWFNHPEDLVWSLGKIERLIPREVKVEDADKTQEAFCRSKTKEVRIAHGR
jgi:antitoxin HicB